MFAGKHPWMLWAWCVFALIATQRAIAHPSGYAAISALAAIAGIALTWRNLRLGR